MSRLGMLRLIWLVLSTLGATSAAASGPGEAAGGSQSSPAVKTVPSRADFVVLVWYRRDDALATFQYQVYDVRKGEYTSAVGDWVKDIQTKYHAYLVQVRTVDLSREAGETEKLKVGSVIHRELMAAAARAGVVLGAPINLSPGPSYSGQNQPRVNRVTAPVGTDRSFLNPGPTTPSIPVYPRTRPP